MIFWYNRYIQSGKKTTLPFMTEQWADDIKTDYQEVLYDKYKDDWKFNEVKETILKSLPIEKRKAIEEEYGLNLVK